MKRFIPLLVAVFVAASVVWPAAALAADPVLIVKDYKTDPEQVTPGSRFKLNITINNATSTSALDTVVTLGGGSYSTGDENGGGGSAGGDAGTGNDIATLGTGNAKFIGTVIGNSNATVTFDMIASPSARPGVYNMPVTIDCSCDTGVTGSNPRKKQFSQNIGLIVTREATFDITSFDYPASGRRGEQFEMNAEISNSSDFTVEGVTLKLESAGLELLDAESYVGKLEAGDSADFSARGIGSQAGLQTVTLIISYKDDFNQTKEIKKDYTIQIEEGMSVPTGTAEPAAETEEAPAASSFGSRMGLFFKAFLGLGA